MRNYYKAIPLFIFLIIFSLPALATLDYDILIEDVAMTANCRDIDCINASGTIKCAVGCTGSIYMFNETLGGLAGVDTSAQQSGILQSVIMYNFSHVYAHEASETRFLRWNSLTGGVGTPIGSGMASNQYGGDFYETEEDLYLPDTMDKVINHTGSPPGTIFLSYWIDGAVDITIPNATDNSTIFVSDFQSHNQINIYVNGVNNSRLNINGLFGTSTIRGFSAIKVSDDTTWLYLLAGGMDSTHWDLWRVNLTYAEASSYSIIEPVSPYYNETIDSEVFNFQVNLNAGTNGTVMWYFYDGSITQWANSSVTFAPGVSSVSVEHSELPRGEYYWLAIFLDDNGVQWSTYPIVFTVLDTGGLIPLLKLAVSETLGIDYDDAGFIIGLLTSLALAITVTMKLKHNADSSTVFIAIFIFSMLATWAVGLVPDFYILLMAFFGVIVAVIKFKGG